MCCISVYQKGREGNSMCADENKKEEAVVRIGDKILEGAKGEKPDTTRPDPVVPETQDNDDSGGSE